jgi:trans-aconitate 2-methyltransferase
VSDWEPRLYLKFADERTRPARDLLAQITLGDPRSVYDLGCGPGNSTALLAARYPQATITGVDNSPAMLAAARAALPQCRFVAADLRDWEPDRPADLLFANATFQWLADHLAVLARLAHGLKEGGVLAVQMPDNLEEPSHRLMAETAAQGPWSGRLKAASAARLPLPAPAEYYDRLRPELSAIDIWHTAYQHPLKGAAAVVAWLEATGLRPYLEALAPSERREFLAIYEKRIAEAYPPQADGTVLLRFPRLFILGVR